jgi:hypothetical protein
MAAGGAALVRAEAVVLALVPAASLASLGAWRPSRRVLAATLLGTLVALAPWTVRNLRVFGAFVPTSTSLGRTLWIGHNSLADGGMNDAIQRAMEATVTAAGPFAEGPARELAVNRLLLRDALGFAAAHPWRELVLTPARAYHLFRGDHVWQAWYDPGTPRLMPSETGRRLLGRLGNAYYAIVGVLAVGGWRLLGVLGLAWVGIFTAIYGDPRFHHLLVPLACIPAATTVTRLADSRHAPERDVAPAA